MAIQRQGSFFFGQHLVDAPGTYQPSQAVTENSGDLFSVGQGYASFQIPPDPLPLPIVMIHGGGQTGKTFEDGRAEEGFRTIFVRRRWSAYVADLTGRGRAGITSFTGPVGELGGRRVAPSRTARYGLKAAVNMFRIGWWGEGELEFYPGVQFSTTQSDLEQLAAGTVAYELSAPFGGDVPADDDDVMSDNIVALLAETGSAILLTHSQSGRFGWLAATKSANVRAVISYEPSRFIHPTQPDQSPMRKEPPPRPSIRSLSPEWYSNDLRISRFWSSSVTSYLGGMSCDVGRERAGFAP